MFFTALQATHEGNGKIFSWIVSLQNFRKNDRKLGEERTFEEQYIFSMGYGFWRSQVLICAEKTTEHTSIKLTANNSGLPFMKALIPLAEGWVWGGCEGLC